MPGNNAQGWLTEEWAKGIAGAIEGMTGAAPAQDIQAAPEDAADDDGLLWWEQSFSPGLDAALWVGAGEPSWKLIGDRVLRAAGIDDGDLDTLQGTYREILSQSLSTLARACSNRKRKEVSCSRGVDAAPPASAVTRFQLRLSFDDADHAVLIVCFANSLSAFVSANEPTEEPKQRAAAAAAGASDSGGEETSVARKPHHLDLLLDVELPVSLSFGRAQLALKEVIKLTTGSIVELNRSVSEPVDVIINNCIIARGEVVVVDGNFGVRIQEVVSRQERLKTLR